MDGHRLKRTVASIRGAVQLAKLANLSYEDRHAYELSLKYYRDFIDVMDTAKKEAKEQGREEGLSIETVMKITGLSPVDILE